MSNLTFKLTLRKAIFEHQKMQFAKPINYKRTGVEFKCKVILFYSRQIYLRCELEIQTAVRRFQLQPKKQNMIVFTKASR